MAFNESRLLDAVAYGSDFGHEYRTRVKSLRSGHERRNADWARARGRYRVLYKNIQPLDHALVIAAHHACMGMLDGFRLKDWTDFTATDEPLGTGTGAAQDIQLIKTYAFGSLTTVRDIYKPVAGEVTIYVDGAPDLGAVIDTTTGIVTITATDGAVLTWSGEFDTPVRFDSDQLSFSSDNRNAAGLILNADVPLVEIRV